MGYMLEIQNIHKTFNPGTINEKVALNGVNLNLNPGDFVTIIGGKWCRKIHHTECDRRSVVCRRRKDHH